MQVSPGGQYTPSADNLLLSPQRPSPSNPQQISPNYSGQAHSPQIPASGVSPQSGMAGVMSPQMGMAPQMSPQMGGAPQMSPQMTSPGAQAQLRGGFNPSQGNYGAERM